MAFFWKNAPLMALISVPFLDLFFYCFFLPLVLEKCSSEPMFDLRLVPLFIGGNWIAGFGGLHTTLV